MGLGLPLIAWGAPEAIAAAPWASLGTPIVTAGQADPFGGTGAVLVEDDNAGASEARVRSIGILGGSRAIVFPMVRQGTASPNDFILLETGPLTTKLQIRWTWTAGVPVASIVTGGANATLYGTISLGGGWYGTLAMIVGLTVGVAHEIRCYGAIPGGVAVGSTYYYLRNCVLLDYLDEDKAWDRPPEGADQLRSPTGLTDRWIPGGRRDYHFRGRARWIPSSARGNPVIVSGWDGLNESIAVNVGVRAMLKAGQEGQDLLWVPDRSLCSQFITSELVKPWIDDPYDHEETPGDRSLLLELRNISTVYPTLL